MALKITTQIGTDKGITSEAYVRISEYQVSKYGSASFQVELFQTEADKLEGGPASLTYNGKAKSQQIGDVLSVALTKEIDATKTVSKEVLVDSPRTTNEDGTMNPSTPQWETQEITETYKVTVPDLSPLEQGTIFEFGYSHLKEKLVGLFGAENVIDC